MNAAAEARGFTNECLTSLFIRLDHKPSKTCFPGKNSGTEGREGNKGPAAPNCFPSLPWLPSVEFTWLPLTPVPVLPRFSLCRICVDLFRSVSIFVLRGFSLWLRLPRRRQTASLRSLRCLLLNSPRPPLTSVPVPPRFAFAVPVLICSDPCPSVFKFVIHRLHFLRICVQAPSARKSTSSIACQKLQNTTAQQVRRASPSAEPPTFCALTPMHLFSEGAQKVAHHQAPHTSHRVHSAFRIPHSLIPHLPCRLPNHPRIKPINMIQFVAAVGEVDQ